MDMGLLSEEYQITSINISSHQRETVVWNFLLSPQFREVNTIRVAPTLLHRGIFQVEAGMHTAFLLFMIS
jgi:hypothetical protein